MQQDLIGNAGSSRQPIRNDTMSVGPMMVDVEFDHLGEVLSASFFQL